LRKGIGVEKIPSRCSFYTSTRRLLEFGLAELRIIGATPARLFGTRYAKKTHKMVPEVSMSTNFVIPNTVVNNHQIEARAEAVIARFEANRDLMWKQDGSALAELLQAQILAKAVLEKLKKLE
jgi:hypothetical protein